MPGVLGRLPSLTASTDFLSSVGRALVVVVVAERHMVVPAQAMATAPVPMAMGLALPTQHQQLLHQLQCPLLRLPTVESAPTVRQHLLME